MVKALSFFIIKLQQEKSCPVSPHVASNLFEPTSYTTCRIQLVGSCVTGISFAHGNVCMAMALSIYSDLKNISHTTITPSKSHER